MTSYITITDAETDPSAPLTSELAKKWRDNPIAMSEGSSGAPKFFVNSMYPPNVGSGINKNALPTGSVSETASSASVVKQNVPSSFVTALVDGTIRYTITFTKTQQSFLDVYKNGVVVQQYTTAQTGATVDIALSAGDCAGIAINAQGTLSNSGTITLTVCRITATVRSAALL